MPTKLNRTEPSEVINPLYRESNGQYVLSFRQTVKIKMKDIQKGIYSSYRTI